MVDAFKADIDSVIFGADSFWQGVDVPGEALSNVIIVRLPFSVPSHPLLEARLEDIRRQGRNPFVEYQVPEAVIKLKQGFGRLIRSRTDRGIVVILDPRVLTKPYGRTFLNSLPACPRVVEDFGPGQIR
jgi:ATP-dependent DNA helicase DinG